MSKKKIKGIVINPLINKITEHVFNDETFLDEVYETIECCIITTATQLTKLDPILIDDNALSVEYNRWFQVDNDPNLLFYGTGVIIGATEDELISTTLSLDEVKKRITFQEDE